MFQPSSDVKELVLAMINGASAEKWVREKWGVQGAPPKLAKFARDMQTVRANVQRWFPEVWKCTEGAGSDWKRRNRAVHLLMTALEDDVLEAMREALPRFGVQCDALTGDGRRAFGATYERGGHPHDRSAAGAGGGSALQDGRCGEVGREDAGRQRGHRMANARVQRVVRGRELLVERLWQQRRWERVKLHSLRGEAHI